MIKTIAICLLTVVALSSCGGNDPLNLFGDSEEPPSMTLPSASFSAVANYSPTQSRSGFFFTIGSNAPVTSPVTGLISSIDLEVAGGIGRPAVTITYNARFSVKVNQMASTSRRVGDYVTTGSSLGVADSTQNLGVTLLMDGASVCPYSYFGPNDRVAINGVLNVDPCEL